MEPDQLPSTSSTSAPPSNPLYSLQPASTDKRPFHDNRSDERLLDPFGPPQGTSMWPGMFQEDLLSDVSYHSSMPGGNGATANFNISNVSHTNMHCDSLSLGTPSQQFQHSNAPQHLGTLEYPYFGQPQTIYPFPANNIFLGGPQSASLPQSNLVCDPQSQEPIELDLLYPPFHANTLFGPPAEAATTSRRHEPVDQSEPRVIDGPPSAVRGIGLESPRAADGKTTVQVRRDTCITLSFDMQSLSKGSIIYDGLKIPSTPSVRSHCSEDGKKLLHLEIRVLGATTRIEYGTVCHVCKDREGDRDAFPDFRAKGNILVPKKNGKLLVSFTLACYSKHREPRDSEYCLKVILNGGPEQNSPLIEHELPYSFSIVTRLPPQPRSRGEVVGDVAPPPTKRPRTRSRRAGRAGNAAPQSVVSSDPDEISFGDSRGSTNNIPLGTSENLVPPMEHRHPAPPAEAAMPPHQCRQTVNTPSGEETVDGLNLVIERINPCQGPTAGGPEIWISGSNFPTHLMPLYARFGDNCAHVVSLLPGLLSCRLPPANVPGMVPVWLTHSLDPSAPVLGTSLCQFEYVTDLNQILPVIIRIQENCTPEVAAGLDVLHQEMKQRNLKTNEKRPLREEETRHDEIETAIIQALAPLHNTLDFGGLISKTNDYKQTLAHFAVLFGYTNLLKRLVGWNIDLAIADVNGFTALHCAYKKGDRVCVDLLLEKGASETVLDALGRAPSQLMPRGFDSRSPLVSHSPFTDDCHDDCHDYYEPQDDTPSSKTKTPTVHPVRPRVQLTPPHSAAASAPAVDDMANLSRIGVLRATASMGELHSRGQLPSSPPSNSYSNPIAITPSNAHRANASAGTGTGTCTLNPNNSLDFTHLPAPRATAFRQDDWMCTAPRCGAHNFGRNSACIGCGWARHQPGGLTTAATFGFGNIGGMSSTNINIGPRGGAMDIGLGMAHQSAAISSGAARSGDGNGIPRFTAASSSSSSAPASTPTADVNGLGLETAIGNLSLSLHPSAIQASGGPGGLNALHAAILAHQQQQREQVRGVVDRPKVAHETIHGNNTSNNGKEMATAPYTIPSLLTPSGRRIAHGGTVRNVSGDTTNPIFMFWPDNEPLPEPGQCRPSGLLTGFGGNGSGPLPPIVNTGNKDPIETQLGDWTCRKCEYLNRRRKRVCALCFPHAEGNSRVPEATSQMLSQSSSGVSQPLNASSAVSPGQGGSTPDTHIPSETSPLQMGSPPHTRNKGINQITDETLLEEVDLEKGPTTGGIRIALFGENFPAVPLYVGFGDNWVRARRRDARTLRCRLPPSAHPGIVSVTLSQTPSRNAREVGWSTATFEYEDSRAEALLSILKTIWQSADETTRQMRSAQWFTTMNTHYSTSLNTGTTHSNSQERREMPPNLEEVNLEDISIDFLCIYSTHPNWKQLVSSRNDYGQTMAHICVTLGYFRLLQHLSTWKIDLNVVDHMGSTALHYAYLFMQEECARLLIHSGAERFILDDLGRSPSSLNPSLEDSIHPIMEIGGDSSRLSTPSAKFTIEMPEEADGLYAKHFLVQQWTRGIEDERRSEMREMPPPRYRRHDVRGHSDTPNTAPSNHSEGESIGRVMDYQSFTQTIQCPQGIPTLVAPQEMETLSDLVVPFGLLSPPTGTSDQASDQAKMDGPGHTESHDYDASNSILRNYRRVGSQGTAGRDASLSSGTGNPQEGQESLKSVPGTPTTHSHTIQPLLNKSLLSERTDLTALRQDTRQFSDITLHLRESGLLSLPTEVLCAIVEELDCLSPEMTQTSGLQHPGFALSQVCRRLRGISPRNFFGNPPPLTPSHLMSRFEGLTTDSNIGRYVYSLSISLATLDSKDESILSSILDYLVELGVLKIIYPRGDVHQYTQLIPACCRRTSLKGLHVEEANLDMTVTSGESSPGYFVDHLVQAVLGVHSIYLESFAHIASLPLHPYTFTALRTRATHLKRIVFRSSIQSNLRVLFNQPTQWASASQLKQLDIRTCSGVHLGVIAAHVANGVFGQLQKLSVIRSGYNDDGLFKVVIEPPKWTIGVLKRLDVDHVNQREVMALSIIHVQEIYVTRCFTDGLPNLLEAGGWPELQTLHIHSRENGSGAPVLRLRRACEARGISLLIDAVPYGNCDCSMEEFTEC